ncbi:MAG: hypothetical protein FWF76_01480 [Oscillospiraceae bacterium]|nr:hypothetical protein [Oscillospiraceae bacterium]
MFGNTAGQESCTPLASRVRTTQSIGVFTPELSIKINPVEQVIPARLG